MNNTINLKLDLESAAIILRALEGLQSAGAMGDERAQVIGGYAISRLRAARDLLAANDAAATATVTYQRMNDLYVRDIAALDKAETK